MFFPSIFIGFFIDKFGTIKVNLTGMVLLTVAVGILMAGETMPIYYVGETLQGIGWNLSYISATAIILKMAAPGRELQTIQGLNDMISQTVGGIFGVVGRCRCLIWIGLTFLCYNRFRGHCTTQCTGDPLWRSL